MTVIEPDATWIRDSAALEELGRRLRESDWVAIDTESNSRFVYRERVCLLQLACPDGIFLIDTLELPIGPSALEPLRVSLSDPDQRLYLHGGEYDVACLKRDYELPLAGVFDSQQAASYLGYERTGYGALVQECLGVELPKEHSQYDWGKRPIDPAALQYASDDVRYLHELCEGLQQEVLAADLEEEVAIGNATVMGADAHQTGFDPQGLFRVKGVGRLNGKQLGLAYALYTWRDEAAQAADSPPGRILPNDALVQIARIGPTNFGSLKRIRMHPQSLRRYGEQILGCVKTHRHDPPTPPEPPARREPDPAERGRESALKAWRRQEAERRQVTVAVVLPARALEYLKKHGPEADLEQAPQLGAKRIRLYGNRLRQVLRQAD